MDRIVNEISLIIQSKLYWFLKPDLFNFFFLLPFFLSYISIFIYLLFFLFFGFIIFILFPFINFFYWFIFLFHNLISCFYSCYLISWTNSFILFFFLIIFILGFNNFWLSITNNAIFLSFYQRIINLSLVCRNFYSSTRDEWNFLQTATAYTILGVSGARIVKIEI